jgi:triacylglycerol esterase/lipase EstA (alpha/beta hydrolase family)
MEVAGGSPPVLVAHSMGGLAVRAWLTTSGADSRVHRVITLGTPHHGTWLARFGRTTNARQMRIGSPWLISLAQREPAARYAKFTCCYSHCDNIVFPASTATLPGARNLHVPGTAHVHLAFQGAAFAELLSWIQPTPATTT